MNGSLRGRIQDNLVAIYDWIVFGRFNGVDAQASGLSRKLGLIRRAGMKKSFDWGSRLVICTQNLRVEDLDDLEVDLDSMGLPLAALCANFFPYLLYNIRQWFDNQFTNMKYSQGIIMDKSKKEVIDIELEDWRLTFSDERIKKEIDRFMHGSSNRFVPIEVPLSKDSEKKLKGKNAYILFKGNKITSKDAIEKLQKNEVINVESFPLETRPMTWCDVIYIALKEITKDKMTLITRFPVDSYWNQFPAKIKVLSTIKTEPMIIDGIFYKEYPLIRVEDMNKDTSSKFIDVALPNNVRLDSIGGDFDGDTISSKPPFSIEANEELYDVVNSKKHYISLDGMNAMNVTKEGLQSLYNLTLVLPEDEKSMTQKIDFGY